MLITKESYFQRLVRKFDKAKIKYLLIGRQASVLYGLPVASFDYDLWVSTPSRAAVYNVLVDEEDFEPSATAAARKPVVFFLKDIYKIDVFFAKGFGKINFDDAYARATTMKDKSFSVTVASHRDLIELKKFRRNLSPKDIEDIRFHQSCIRNKASKK